MCLDGWLSRVWMIGARGVRRCVSVLWICVHVQPLFVLALFCVSLGFLFVCLFVFNFANLHFFSLKQAFSYNSVHIFNHKSLSLTLQLYMQSFWKYIQFICMLLSIGEKLNKTNLRFVYAMSFVHKWSVHDCDITSASAISISVFAGVYLRSCSSC